MTTFAKTGFKSINYNSFRPSYPPSFYDTLIDFYGKKRVGKTIDLGCGTGVATFPLLNFSDYVLGLDLSPLMIEAANKLKSERLAQMGISDESRIEFQQGAVETMKQENESFDLITAAECVHWFQDFGLFFKAAAAMLKPNGVLAYWYYVDPVFVGFSGPYDQKRSKEEILQAALEIYAKYAYEDPKWLRDYWEQPGRNILRNGLKLVDEHIPEGLFKEVKIKKFNPDPRKPLEYSDDDLQLVKKDITLGHFIKYMTTFSSYHNFEEATGDKLGLEASVLKDFEALGWDKDETKVDVAWYSGYTFLRKGSD